MAAAFLSPIYMKNRCCSTSFLIAPNGWRTFSNPPKRLSLSARSLAHRGWNIQKICSVQSMIKSRISSRKPGIGHGLHTSARYRSNLNACCLSLDFWDVAFLSLAAVGLSIGFIKSYPYQHNNLISLEAIDNDDCLALKNVSGESGGGMKADIEMTLHQPPAFNGHVKTTSTMSVDTQSTSLNKSVASSKPYDISVRAIKGGRVTMEDEYFVADGGRFVAVFDGHGGGGVSQYLKNHLYDAVYNHVQIKHWEENDALLNRPSPSIRGTTCDTAHKQGSDAEIPSVFSFAAALKSAFSEIEHNVLENDMLQFQGSTAVAVLIHEKLGGDSSNETTKHRHRTLLSANIGDSRAVLSRNGRAVDLTRDHKPNDDQEKSRILAMGETIEWDRVSKVHRVRNLSLSRAIGDKYAKPVVSGEVEINHYPLIEQSDEFILLASDGLWDVMTSGEAVAFVHEKIQKEISSINIAKGDLANFTLVLRRNMAKFVAREAIRRGSSDNVCVVMVWLDDVG